MPDSDSKVQPHAREAQISPRLDAATMDRLMTYGNVETPVTSTALFERGDGAGRGWARLAPTAWQALRRSRAHHDADACRQRHHDLMLNTINSFHLQQNLPNARLIIYPNSGHVPHCQDAYLFLAHARLFLDR